MFAVGPGLFPARLRRSSACACAAAAVSRVKKNTPFTQRTSVTSCHIWLSRSNNKKETLATNHV